MSSDLFAAFGSPQDTRTTQQESESHKKDDDERWETDSWSALNEALEDAWTGSSAAQVSSRPPVAAPVEDGNSNKTASADDEELGDFEEPQPDFAAAEDPHTTSSYNVGSTAHERDADEFGEFAEAEKDFDFPEQVSAPSAPGKSTTKKAAAATRSAKPKQELSVPDFEALIDFVQADPTVSYSTVIQASDPISSEPQRKSTSQKEVPILQALSDSEADDDDWDDGWGTSVPPRQKRLMTSAAPSKSVEKRKDEGASKQSTPGPRSGKPPPTNVPPPSVLMYLLSILIPKFSKQIRITIVETYEDGEADVTKHLDTILVAARILAGRKLRWKRDKHLAQSMKIGAAGRQGGMKLAGVDRAEVQREEREASELVRIWRQHLPAIRTALSGATSSYSKPKPLPVLVEAALVRTAKAEDGAITAPRCCVLCGLNRDERVDKVDREVWDQFGEWWTEHWGHQACQSFWSGHSSLLKQR